MRKCWYLVFVVSAVSGGPLSFAADTGTSEATPVLEEIVVTAQKRAERLQDVPITVSSVDRQQLTAAGITNIDQLATVVPGINLNKIGSESEIFIRGVGTNGGAAGQENAIAVFIDGVYMPSQASANYSFGDIDHIEVLKGPQGTLYGRNATGGAINVVTRTPSFTPSLEAEVGYGNLNTVLGNLYATTGLGDNVAANVAFTYDNQQDGFGRNLTTGAEANTTYDWGLRSKILIKPTDSTRIILSADYTVNQGSLGVDYRSYGPTSTQFITGQVGWPFGFWDTQIDFNPNFDTKNWGLSGRIEQDFSWATFTSITAYRNINAYQSFDVAANPLTTFHAFLDEVNWQWTEELQLASASSEKLKWIAGFFYLSASSGYDPFHVNGDLFVADGFSDEYTHVAQGTTSFAPYGQATYEFIPDTNLTLGARYTHDRRTLTGTGYVVLLDGTQVPAFPPQNNFVDFAHPSYRVALDHKFSQDFMVYASYSTGFHSGVYTTTGTPTSPPVNPEDLYAYEVGAKSTLFDQRLQLNLSAFHYDYKNLQVSIVEGANQEVLNAAEAKMYGIDMDFAAQLAANLTLRGGGEYIHDYYSSFPNAPCSTTNTAFPYGNIITACDATGNHLNRTPDYSFNLGVDYHATVAGGELASGLVFFRTGAFYWNPDNRLRQEPYDLVNAQVKWTAPGGRYHVRVFSANLFNTKYFTYASGEEEGDLAQPAAGRTYGIAFGVKY